MAGTVSTKIELDGGKSFAQALKDIATQAKVMDSEMRAAASSVTTEADANKKAQTQTEALTKRIEEQRAIVARLKAVMEDAATQTGENSNTTAKAKIAYNDAVTALNNMEGQLKDTTGEVKNFSGETKNSEKTSSTAAETFKKVASGIGSAAKAIATTVAAIGAATVAAGKAIYNMANDTATAGDEIDKMSQKIGISTDAYQEWAYVFERSGADVNNLQAGMKTLSGVIADAASGSESAADKLNAVGLSIEQLNGLSQEEQLQLVIDSLQGMEQGAERSAAANDLLGKSASDMAAVLNMTKEDTQALKDEAHDYGMVMGEDAVKASADFKDALTKLDGTLNGLKNGALGQILPAITQLINGISDLAAGNEGAESTISAAVQNIITAIGSMIPEFVNMISTMAGAVMESAPQIITSLAEGLIANLPAILTVAVDTIMALVDGLLSGESLQLLLDGAMQVIMHLVQGLVDNLPTILASAEELIGSLLEGLANGLPQILSMAVQLVTTVLTGLTNPDSLQKMIRGALKLIMELVKGLVQAIPVLVAAIPEIITNIVQTLIDLAPELIVSAIEIISQLVVGLIGAIPQIIASIPKIISSIKERFANYDWGSIGKNIMEGIKNGISNMISNLLSTVKQAASDLLNAAKRALGIGSPSKEFAKVGKFMGQGLDIGMSKSFAVVAKDMKKELSELPVSATATLSAASGSGTPRTFNFGSVNFTVNAAEGQDPRTLAREVERVFLADLRAKEGAFA